MGGILRHIRSKGYTLMELMVSIVILGGMIAFAVPAFDIQQKKVKNQEATRALLALYDAQMDYARDHFGTFAVAGQEGEMSVDIPVSDYFYPPVLSGADEDLSCYGESGTNVYLAKVDSRKDDYSLYITSDGRVVCQPCGDPTNVLCQKMGYNSDWDTSSGGYSGGGSGSSGGAGSGGSGGGGWGWGGGPIGGFSCGS